MVHQSDRSNSLALRAPSSAVTRPALSRARRYNRPTLGGPSYVSHDEFPIFGYSGDVEIVIRAGHHENRYLLHHYTLASCSGFFEASTSQEWSKTLPEPPPSNEVVGPSKATTGSAYPTAYPSTHPSAYPSAYPSAHVSAATARPLSRAKWRYELDLGTGDSDIPMLVQKPALSALEPFDPSSHTSPSLFAETDSHHPLSGRLVVAKQSRALSQSHQHPSSALVSPQPSQPSPHFRSVANLALLPSHGSPAVQLSQSDQDLLRDYDNLFRIFYNHSPVLDGVNIADTYVQCKSLLGLADQYDALAVVGPRVDHHLLQFQSRLWKQIAKYPISYLRMGYLARSKVIFQEALIHVVGQWPIGERSLRAALPDSVLDIIEDKVDELAEVISRIEGRLFRLGLTNAKGQPVTPFISILDWLVISLFRQWLADHTGPQEMDQSGQYPAPPDPDTSSSSPALPTARLNIAALGRAFRTIGASSPSGYLGHEECKKFLKSLPELYSRDNLKRFEKRLDELKTAARDIVRPLMGSGLELDLGAGRISDAISYLTCTTISERDLPWRTEQ